MKDTALQETNNYSYLMLNSSQRQGMWHFSHCLLGLFTAVMLHGDCLMPNNEAVVDVYRLRRLLSQT
jgi:hypothetical protein